MNNRKLKSATRDREKRMDHEIDNGIWNGERIMYSRMENGEWRMENGEWN